MPPHWLHAGPSSRPPIFAGVTGGVSVIAEAAGIVSLSPADACGAGAELPPLAGPAVSEVNELAASSPAFLARTESVMMPSPSCVSVSRKREASQRMM